MENNEFYKFASEIKDYIHKEFKEFNHKIDKLFGKMENHNDRINKLEKRHDKIEEKMTKKFSEIDKRIGVAMGIAVILFAIAKTLLEKLI